MKGFCGLLVASPFSPGDGRTTSTVVIIDHRPAMRFALQAVLSKVAERVFIVDNGQAEAEQVLARHGANCVVFVAHAPPHHDGLRQLAQLRADGQPTRLILYGAALDYKTISSALRLNVDGLLPECAALAEFADCFEAVSDGEKWVSQSVLLTAVIDDVADAGMFGDILNTLTPRQQQIAIMIAKGQSNKQISETTRLTEGTVKMHIHRIFRRLKIANRAALAAVVGDRVSDERENLIMRDDLPIRRVVSSAPTTAAMGLEGRHTSEGFGLADVGSRLPRVQTH